MSMDMTELKWAIDNLRPEEKERVAAELDRLDRKVYQKMEELERKQKEQREQAEKEKKLASRPLSTREKLKMLEGVDEETRKLQEENDAREREKHPERLIDCYATCKNINDIAREYKFKNEEELIEQVQKQCRILGFNYAVLKKERYRNRRLLAQDKLRGKSYSTLDDMDKKQFIERFRKGDNINDICKSLGISVIGLLDTLVKEYDTRDKEFVEILNTRNSNLNASALINRMITLYSNGESYLVIKELLTVGDGFEITSMVKSGCDRVGLDFSDVEEMHGKNMKNVSLTNNDILSLYAEGEPSAVISELVGTRRGMEEAKIKEICKEQNTRYNELYFSRKKRLEDKKERRMETNRAERLKVEELTDTQIAQLIRKGMGPADLAIKLGYITSRVERNNVMQNTKFIQCMLKVLSNLKTTYSELANDMEFDDGKVIKHYISGANAIEMYNLTKMRPDCIKLDMTLICKRNGESLDTLNNIRKIASKVNMEITKEYPSALGGIPEYILDMFMQGYALGKIGEELGANLSSSEVSMMVEYACRQKDMNYDDVEAERVTNMYKQSVLKQAVNKNK